MGTKAIREASLWIAGSWGSQTDIGYMSSRTGDVVKWPTDTRVFDTGDVPILLNNVTAQIEAASDHIAVASRQSAVAGDGTRGGDHYVNYPSFVGVVPRGTIANPDSELRISTLTHTRTSLTK